MWVCRRFPGSGARSEIVARDWRLKIMKRTPFDGLLLIFTATAVLGVIVAYDRTRAGVKLVSILVGIGLFYSLAWGRRRNLPRVWGMLAGLSVVVAAYFLLMHDWQALPADVDILTRIGLWWMGVRPSFTLPAIHPNSAGGLIAIFMPFQIVWGVYGWRKRRPAIWATAVFLGGVTLIGWLMTSSRASWLAFGMALGIGMLWRFSLWAQTAEGWPRQRVFMTLLLLMIGIAAGFAFVLPGGFFALAGSVPGDATAGSRLVLYRQTLALIADFPFTGGGLAAFPGLYSQYIAVTPFFQFNYSHNLWLDVWLEQTFLGLLALLGILGGSGALLWRTAAATSDLARRKRRRALSLSRWATAMGLLILVVHSLVDDALYGGLGTPFLFVLPGIAVAAARRHEVERLRPFSFSAPVFVFLIAGLAALTLQPTPTGRWYANRGATTMAQTELHDWPTQVWDDGRYAAQLTPARLVLQQAIAIQPANRTAQSRLGLIALLERDFETAVAYLQSAHDLDPDHRGIAKSLGYSYVWAGEWEQAVNLLTDIPEARREMKAYVHWWNEQGRPDLAALAEAQAAALKSK